MLIHFLWLLPISGLAFWQYPQLALWPDAWQELVVFSPYVLAALGLFISYWLNRLQPFMILLTLAVFNFSLSYFFGLERDDLTAAFLFPLLALLLPLNLMLWSVIPEKGVHNHSYVFGLLSVLVLQAFLIYWYADALPAEWISYLSQPLPTNSDWIHIPMVALLVMFVAWMMLVIRNALTYQPKAIDVTMIFVFVLMAIGLNAFQQYGVLAWMSSSAILLVILSMIFDAHHIAYTDQLTMLKGRRALEEYYSGLGRKYTIAMMDIDHFKKFNDTYGHDIGDEVLRAVAQEVAMVEGGKAFRYGGEEFTFVFKGKTPEQTKPLVEKIRQAIEKRPLIFEHKGKETQTQVTVSFGVAEKNADFKTPTAVIKAADEALYQAKEAGRNCVFISGEKPIKKKAKRIKQ